MKTVINRLVTFTDTNTNEVFKGVCDNVTDTAIEIDLGSGKGVGVFNLSDGELTVGRKSRRKVEQVSSRPQQVETTKKTKKVKKIASNGKTKADLVFEIYKSHKDEKRGNVIQMIMDQVGMSKAGASTYYYNAKKCAAV